MRWWMRLASTLVLGPALWWIATGYVATQQGATFEQWTQDIAKVLPQTYLVYTAPALVLCGLLLGLDRLLTRLSLDLFTVLLSPLIAFALAWAAVRFVPEPHVRAAGASLALFACYGLVWGLTIREPGKTRTSQDRSDGAFVQALLPRGSVD